MSVFEDAAARIGKIVTDKNKAYGDSVRASGSMLRLLYPTGINPARYDDVLLLVRLFDKMKRIASQEGADPAGESPWDDIAGYGILRVGLMDSTATAGPSTAPSKHKGTLTPGAGCSSFTCRVPCVGCRHPCSSHRFYLPDGTEEASILHGPVPMQDCTDCQDYGYDYDDSCHSFK